MGKRSERFIELDPETLAVHDRYKLLIGVITPRPIAVVSTADRDGKPNLAPYSFFNGVGSNPMTVMFCPANTDTGAEKDTLRNAKPQSEGGTGAFVVNVATGRNVRRIVAAAEPLPFGESEFELAGLTPTPARHVAAPRLAESPVSFECQTVQVVRTNPGAPNAGNVVIGRVVHVWAREGLINERMHTDPEQLDTVGRLGGFGYAHTRDRFELRPGRAALDAAI